MTYQVPLIKYEGDGSTKVFAFPFEYIETKDVYVGLWSDSTGDYVNVPKDSATYPWELTGANLTTITFTGDAPPAPTNAGFENLIIFRDTDIEEINSVFYPANAIRSTDLNDNFEQILFSLQELEQSFSILEGNTIEFLGAIDLTTDEAPADPENGNYYINTGAGDVLASWTGIAGEAVIGTEQVIFTNQGDKWLLIGKEQTGADHYVQDTPPIEAVATDVWWDTTDGRSYILYEDADSVQWVEMNPAWNGSVADGSITADKLADGSVTPEKLSTGGPYWDTSGDLIVGNNPQGGGGKGAKLDNEGRVTACQDDADDVIWAGYRLNNSSRTSTIYASGAAVFNDMVHNTSGGYRFPDGSVQTTASAGGGGTTVNYNGASAWCRSTSTGDDRGNYNIDSINKTGTGKYELTFVTPMDSTSYSILASAVTAEGKRYATVNVIDATKFQVKVLDSNGDGIDSGFSAAVFASNAIAPQYGVGADAWGYMNGDNGNLVNSFNVASTQRTGVGEYLVTFTTAMPGDNYAALATSESSSSVSATVRNADRTANSFVIRTSDTSGASVDSADVSFTVHASSTVTPTYTWTRDGTTLKPANDGDDIEAGSATFAGDIDTQGILSSSPDLRATTGATLYPDGRCVINSSLEKTQSSTPVLRIRDKNKEEVASITNTGSATFAGAVSAPNACTAWVNFAGANGALRGSFNVNGPITRLGTGRYQIVFATEMDNSDYCAQVSSNQLTTIIDDITTTSVDISVFDAGGSRVDTDIVCCTVYGGKN